MQTYTKNGLLLILIGLIIGMVGSLIFGLYQWFFPIEKVGDFIQFIPLGIIGGIGGLISLIGAILFLIGRKEFGEKHRQFVIYALICIIIGIIASIGVSIISTFMMMAGSEEGRITGMSAASVIAPTIISAFTGGLAYVFSLYHLEDENGRKLLYVAFVVSILISVAIAFVVAGGIEEMITDMNKDSEDLTSVFSFTSSVSEYTMFGSISSLLWAIAIYLAYKRIRDGELVPQSSDVLGGISSSVPDRVCPNCNKPIPTDANNCPYCGKQFESYL